MNGFKQYITSFFSGLRSLLVGMRTTLRVFFRKKTTEQYPENRDTLKMFDRFRGQLVMKHNDRNEHRCVACGICRDELSERFDPGRFRDGRGRAGQEEKSARALRVRCRKLPLLPALRAQLPARRDRVRHRFRACGFHARQAGSAAQFGRFNSEKNRRTWKLPYNRPVSPFSPR